VIKGSYKKERKRSPKLRKKRSYEPNLDKWRRLCANSPSLSALRGKLLVSNPTLSAHTLSLFVVSLKLSKSASLSLSLSLGHLTTQQNSTTAVRDIINRRHHQQFNTKRTQSYSFKSTKMPFTAAHQPPCSILREREG
jgi:hypothetical protein